MSYDLHCHTHHSDGALSPDQLVAMAQAANVSVLSFTDHDTVDAYQQPLMNPTPSSLSIIPGVEFSTLWRGVSIHIVGLNIDPNSPAIVEGVHYQKQARSDRAHLIAEKLEKLGAPAPYQGALDYAKGAALGRLHFAKHLVATGFCKDLNQAFRKYLGAGKAGDIKQQWASMGQVISWIRVGGGVSILAHPQHYKLTRTKLLRLIDDFMQQGGQGIEVLSGQQEEKITTQLADVAQAKDMVASMGSDFHSPEHKWTRLGMHRALPANVRPVWDLF